MSRGTYHVANFGCRASQSEGASISESLAEAGAEASASPYLADVLVVNSCTVTEEADKEVRRLIRRVARRNPDARIVLTGCYAQRRPDELARMERVRYVVGNSHKHRVPDLALECLDDPVGHGRAQVFCSRVFEGTALSASDRPGSGGRTRATLKVQDGCDAKCSFCIIPTVRGRGRSLPAEAVVDQVRALVDRGYREVVFSGIHLGSYGRDLDPRRSLAGLVRHTLEAVPGLERLRLSSIEPMEVTAEVIELVATHPRMARHFHVPLQSGSARVLGAMRRPYHPEDYAATVGRIRRTVPDAAIGADVMVGFPGETDAEFLATCELIESLPLTYLHVFPYSPRPGTVAASLPDPVPTHVSGFRGRRLRERIRAQNLRFREGFIGRDLEVLTLEEPACGQWRAAVSDNFIRVSVPADLQVNRWHRVRIAGLEEQGLRSEASGFQNDDGGRDGLIVGQRDVEAFGAQ